MKQPLTLGVVQPPHVRVSWQIQPRCFLPAPGLDAFWGGSGRRVHRVGIEYHVEVEGHFYSVPHRFARIEVEVRLTSRTLEIFAKGERVAVHLRSSGNGKH